MKIFFVAGTDTGVGKTFFCAGLARELYQRQVDVLCQKWVTSGTGEVSEDLAFCYKAMGRSGYSCRQGTFEAPYTFRFPASPHLAAEKEGRQVDIEALLKATEELSRRCEILLIEGVGGIMVPLTRNLLLIDLVKRLHIPVIVVARAGLGTINHTLLTIEALNARSIALAGLVFNDLEPGSDKEIVRDNMKTIKDFCPEADLFGLIPYRHDLTHSCPAISKAADFITGDARQ